MNDKIAELHEEVNSSKQVVQPYIETLSSSDNSQSLDSFETQNQQEWEKVTESIMMELDSTEDGSEKSIALKSAIDMLDQLKEMRGPIIEKCRENHQASLNWKLTQKAFINAVVDTSKDLERSEKYVAIKELLIKMEKLYADFEVEYGVDSKVDQWCYALQSAESEMIKAMQNQEDTVSMQIIQTTTEEELAEIKAMEEELAQLEKDDDALDEEYAEICQQLETEKEDVFIKLQEREAYDYRKSEGSINEYKLNKYKEIVICPVCKENPRGYILRCKHAVCEKCSQLDDRCPICHEPYGDEKPVRFYFQK